MNTVAVRLAEIPAGSWTKWIVVGFWLVVLVIALPLSGKLMGAEKNDASAWLRRHSGQCSSVIAACVVRLPPGKVMRIEGWAASRGFLRGRRGLR